jgi:hypothetical protein
MLYRQTRLNPYIFPLILYFLALLGASNKATAQTPVALAPVVRQQFFSSSGIPLAGGCVATYASGTSTPQATYTDSSGSFQNANPITLDAGGFAGIWLSNTAYRIVVFSAPISPNTCATMPGNQQYLVDNVTSWQIFNSLVSLQFTGSTSYPAGTAGQIIYRSDLACLAIFTTSWNCLIASSPGTLSAVSITTGAIDQIIYIDGTYNPYTAAGINAADASLGSGPGTINIFHPGAYCDTRVNLSNGHTLIFGPGIYQMNIAGADSTSLNVSWGIQGQGSNQTTIQSCPGANKDVITSQNFSSFTGGANFYGVFHPVIRNLTVDGNKGTESAGYGIRLYGRSPAPSDVVTINCFQDGQWWEWGGTANDTGSGTSVNGNSGVLESDYNGGNGFSIKASGVSPGALNAIGTLIAHNNGGWGLQTQISLSAQTINVYENTSGGCDVQAPGGGLSATNAGCTTATGWGLLQESSAGQVDIKGGFLAGGIPVELRSGSGGTIMTEIANPAAATTCLKLNGAGNFVIVAEFISCSTSLISFTSEVGPNFITGVETGATSNIYTGTPNIQDNLMLSVSGGAKYTQFIQPTIFGSSGALLISPTAPTITSHFNTSGDSIISNGTAAMVVTTGTGAGTTTGTIGLPTASNGWSCWINGAGFSLPTQSGSTVSSASFTNYNTSLTPVNWTNSISLRIGCTGY